MQDIIIAFYVILIFNLAQWLWILLLDIPIMVHSGLAKLKSGKSWAEARVPISLGTKKPDMNMKEYRSSIVFVVSGSNAY